MLCGCVCLHTYLTDIFLVFSVSSRIALALFLILFCALTAICFLRGELGAKTPWKCLRWLRG